MDYRSAPYNRSRWEYRSGDVYDDSGQPVVFWSGFDGATGTFEKGQRLAKKVVDDHNKLIDLAEGGPIPMVLFCPECFTLHVDVPSETWDNPPHRSHLCGNCGCIWRPADVATVGVAPNSLHSKGVRDTWHGSATSQDQPAEAK